VSIASPTYLYLATDLTAKAGGESSMSGKGEAQRNGLVGGRHCKSHMVKPVLVEL
jgi:hypothetical protein